MVNKINRKYTRNRKMYESKKPIDDYEKDVLNSKMGDLIDMANELIDEIKDYKYSITFANEYDADDVDYAIRNVRQGLDNCSTYLSYLRTALH